MSLFAELKGYNKYAKFNKSLIRKALTSATGVGEALIPQKLEKIITNTVVRLSPELAMIDPEFDNQKYHEFNRLTSLPAPGGAMGESAVTPTRNSTWERTGVNMKIIRRKGAVANFLQDTSAKYIDAAAAEMESHLMTHCYDLATYIMYGNAGADVYTHSGLDHFISTNRINEVVGGTVPTDLEFLDNLIDVNLDYQGAAHRKAIVMSPKMLSKVSRLLTNVRLNQGVVGNGLTQIEVNGGWRLFAYRDIPIISSGACRPKATMGTVTATPATSGGNLADADYYFKVAPITYNGEELASAEATATVSGGSGAGKVTLTFTAHTGALYYKVYMSTTSGATKLRRIFSAFTYDSAGTITGNNTSLEITATTAGSEVPSHMQSDNPLVATGGIPPETIFFWDLDKYQGLGKYAYTNTAGSKFNGLVTINPLAITDDDIPFLVKTYGASVPAFEKTSGMIRGLRVA